VLKIFPIIFSPHRWLGQLVGEVRVKSSSAEGRGEEGDSVFKVA